MPKKFSSADIRERRPFARGKRGIVERALYRGKEICIKSPHPESGAIGNLEHEFNMLSLLHKEGLPVPRPIAFERGALYYYYREGETLRDFLKEDVPDREILLSLVLQVTDALYRLDLLGISKEEMQHPTKHIIIDRRGEVSLIDFERARRTMAPKNLTQWLQYLGSESLQKELIRRSILYDRHRLMLFSLSYKRVIGRYHKARYEKPGTEKPPEKEFRIISSYLSMETFDQQVWRATLSIPEGKVATYQTVAGMIGRPTAQRAVAQALHRNPFAPEVPCHRVIAAGGAIGGYGGGLAPKIRLLKEEGVPASEKGRIPEEFLLKIR